METNIEAKIQRKRLNNNDRRTIFSYQRIPRWIKEEFKASVRTFVDEKNKWKLRTTYGVERSANNLFYWDNEQFFINRSVNKDNRYDTPKYNDRYYFSYNDDNRIKMYRANCDDEREDVIWFLMMIMFHDVMVEDLWDSRTKTDVGLFKYGRYETSTVFYKKAKFFDDSIELYIRDYISNIRQFTYTHPMDYCNFRMHEEDEKMMKFDYRGRTTIMKAGKCIKKMFKIINQEQDDNTIKLLSNKLTGNFEGFELVVVSGEDIPYYYHHSRYSSSQNLGSLGSSCMKYDECRDNNYFEVYEDNAEMLIFRNKEDDTIIGRAILWKAIDYDGNKCNVMDRIYASEKVYVKFFAWAKENGYYRKRYQSYTNEVEWVFEGRELDKYFSIYLDIADYQHKPYMDTFAWGDNECIVNRAYYGCFEMRSTGGGLSRGEDQWEEELEEDYDE